MDDFKVKVIEWLNNSFNSPDFFKMTQKQRLLHIEAVADELIESTDGEEEQVRVLQ